MPFMTTAELQSHHRHLPNSLALLDLMQRHGITEQAEALTLMIHNLHAMPPSESAAAFAVPRHEYAISANVARHIQAAGRREAARLDRQEA